ncbi:hypothetical protein Lal_00021376 [Lupinus albus]|nr:hypothetical protein Lal_00021376 [Lupinus albus]
MDWEDLCVQLLGVSPTDRQIMGQRIQHTWLESIYQELPEDVDEELVEQQAISFILIMIGGFLMWSQHLITTKIPGHAANIIRAMLDHLRVDQFNFATELMERTTAPQSYNNPIQTIDYVHQTCKELVNALAELNPMAFNISQHQAPPSQHFVMSTYDSELQHQSSSQTHFQPPQPQMLSPHLYREQLYGAFTTYPTNYHMGQISQYQGSLPSMFATTSNTPISADGTQDFYHPTMPSQVQQGNIYGNEDNEDDEDDDGDDEEEEHQLQTRGSGRAVEISQQQLRALPPRRRKSPLVQFLHIIDVNDSLGIVCLLIFSI